MTLIADSGSTKTDWCMENTTIIHTQGINPFHQSAEYIKHILTDELLSQLPKDITIRDIHFYGAGCTPEKSVILKDILATHFPESTIEVQSDLVGAARALCGNAPGIACILGTGSNSCYYDGKQIISNISPLGFILGDEGSGAVLGKRLVGDCLKNQLPKDICDAFLQTFKLTPAQIIEKVYRQPQANRFLASLAPFLATHRTVPQIHNLLVSSFKDFFQRNILQYPYQGTQVHFVGSIGWHFQEEVKEAAQTFGIETGKFIQSPITELQKYHQI